jgi:ankyrin repeat protein
MKLLLQTSLIALLVALGSPVHADIDAQLREIDKSIRVRDYARAVQLLKPLVKANQAEANFRMGALFRSGRGVQQDIDKAMKHYESAALQGHAEAQYALASLLEKRAQDNEARKWYRIAAEQGHRKSARKLENLNDLANSRASCIDPEMVFNSILRDDLQQIQACIDGGVDLMVLDSNDHTPLVAAILAEKQEMIALLLPVTKNIEQSDNKGNRALHYAVAKDYRKVVQRLLGAGARVNQPDGLGNTALAIAVRHDNAVMVDLLLKRKANPRVRNNKKKTAIDLAIARGDQKVASAFSRNGINLQKSSQRTLAVDVDSFEKSIRKSGDALYKGWPILSIASLLGEEQIVKQLLAKKVDVNARDQLANTALHRAASKEQTKVMGLLLAAGAKVDARNKNGETPLYLAARAGRATAVKNLLAKGADSRILTADKQSALEVAIANQHEAAAMQLVRKPLNPQARHNALILAVQNGLTEPSLVLVAVDKFLEKPDKNKRTVLWYSAENGMEKVVAKLILRKQRGVDIADVKGYTPLARAVTNGHQSIAQLLIVAGADLTATTTEKNTLLMLAVASGKSAMVDRILSTKPDLDAKNTTGETALMIAAALGNQGIVEKLVNAGANTQLRNRDDMNAFEIATNAGHEEVAVFIKEKSNKLFKLFN